MSQPPPQQPHEPVPDNPYARPEQQAPPKGPPQGPYDPLPYGPQPYGPQPPADPPRPGTPPEESSTPQKPAKPAAGARDRRRRKQFAIIAGLIALVLVAGGSVWLFGDGAEERGGDGAALTVRHEGGKVGGLLRNTEGSWVTDKIYAKSVQGAIEGYPVDGGDRAWRLPLDADICTTSLRTTEDNLAAVAIGGQYSDCASVLVFDVETGKKLWEKPIPKVMGGAQTDMTIAEGTLAISWGGGAVAYDIKGGPPRWKTKITDHCQYSRFAGGPKLLAVVECGHRNVTVNRLAPETGHSIWDVRLPKGIENTDVRIVDTDPVVLMLETDDELAHELITVDDEGRTRTTISVRKDYATGCSNGNRKSEACFNIVATDDTVYLATEQHQGGAGGMTNEILAFDAGTGRVKWKSRAGGGRTVFPFGEQGERILAYRTPTNRKGAAVLTVSPKDGAQRVLMPLPDGSWREQREFTVPGFESSAPVSYRNGRVFLQKGALYKGAEKGALLAMGFTASG